MKWMFILLPLFMASCSKSPVARSTDAIHVEDKSLAEVQLHSVVNQVSHSQWAVQELANLEQLNLPLYDFKGNKTHWLHVLSTEPVSLRETMSSNVQGTVALVGANTLSTPIVFHEKSLKLFEKLKKVVKEFGIQNIKSWHINPKLQIYALLNSKKFIDVTSLKPLTPAEIVDQVNLAAQQRQFLGQPKIQEYIKTLWSRGSAVRQSSKIDQPKLTSDQQLDLRALVELHGGELQNIDVGYDVQSFDEKSDQSCFWNQCWDSRAKGQLKEQYLELSGGFAQFPTDYGLRNSIHNVPHCGWAPFNTKPPMYTWLDKPVYPMGCGPSAMASLLDWWWRYKGLVVRGKSYSGQPAVYRIDPNNQLTSSRWVDGASIWNDFFEVDSEGRSKLVEVFGSCYLYAGTFTLPNQISDRTPAFLKWAQVDQKVELQSVYNYFAANALPFLNNTGEMAKRLRTEMGQMNLPVVAMYPFGDLQMHYSPILEYDISYKLGYALVMVRPLDQPQRWVNLSDPWNLASGLFSLKHKQ